MIVSVLNIHIPCNYETMPSFYYSKKMMTKKSYIPHLATYGTITELEITVGH